MDGVSKTIKIVIFFTILFALGGGAFVGYKIGQKKEDEEGKEEEPKKKTSVISNPNLKKQTTESVKELTKEGLTESEPE